MVLLAHELGLGYAALKKISKVLGIPALHLKTYQRHDSGRNRERPGVTSQDKGAELFSFLTSSALIKALAIFS
ncbi:Acid alpha-amylase [Dissostichus eleginoides]|uniref:Acid alpha-amylase n=1 Tax=Dissostichus eleginoides TaxID=100907 RepID=A0AAD9FD47_DISEL|nr:Acid alpha-amylase [Dissostichus eleginoides]